LLHIAIPTSFVAPENLMALAQYYRNTGRNPDMRAITLRFGGMSGVARAKTFGSLWFKALGIYTLAGELEVSLVRLPWPGGEPWQPAL
jgi:hypothetical protein